MELAKVGVQVWGARARAVFLASAGEAASAGIMARSARHIGLALAVTAVAARRSAARILSLI